VKPAVAIAGGGTGGHVMPAVAVAQALKEMAPGLRVVLVGVGSEVERRMARSHGLELVAIAAKGFVGKGALGKVGALARVCLGIRGLRAVLRQMGAGVVLGMGGYGCVAPVLAARTLGLPVGLQEQNAVPGLATRVLAPTAEVIFVGFAGAADYLGHVRVVITGNPVRPGVIARAREAARGRPEPSRELRITVLGGSQGAQALNELVPAAMHTVARRYNLRVRHQAGAGKAQGPRRAYAEAGIHAEVKEFYEDVGECYGWAHLVICRAGAITISELLATGRASILVPYPHAGAHQRANALAAERMGAAVVAEQDELGAEALGRVVIELVQQGRLEQMEQAAQRAGRKDAARTIAGWCLKKLEEASV